VPPKEEDSTIHIFPDATRTNVGRHTMPGPPENEAGMLFYDIRFMIMKLLLVCSRRNLQYYNIITEEYVDPQSLALPFIKLLGIFITISGSLSNANEF